MLVLTRRKHQGIVLLRGKEVIRFTLVEPRGYISARLGVEADKSWKVLRTPDHDQDIEKLMREAHRGEGERRES